MSALVLLVLSCLLAGNVCAAELGSFYIHEVVPDVIPAAPEVLLNVEWPETGAVVQEGEVLFNTQLQDMPDVQWEADPDQHYALLMTDADAPSRTDRSRSEVRHWVIVNIPGNNVDRGLTLASYIPSRGVQDLGLHRYIFLVYSQPAYIDPEVFDETWITDPEESRSSWSLIRFVNKYEMSGPVAGNFFQSEWLD